MSDFEDEMDLDAGPANDAITFNSDNTNAKGKRSAANLPVEAEDSLPWYEDAEALSPGRYSLRPCPSGLKNTVPTHLMMSRDIRIFWQPLTSLSSQTYARLFLELLRNSGG